MIFSSLVFLSWKFLHDIYRQINIIRINRQLQHFEEYQERLRAMIGQSQAQKLVNQALFLITLGGNDFVNNYYLIPFSVRSRQFSLPDYVDYILFEYKKILTVTNSLHDFTSILRISTLSSKFTSLEAFMNSAIFFLL